MVNLYYIGNFVSIDNSVYAVGLTHHHKTFDAVDISKLTIDSNTVKTQIQRMGVHVSWTSGSTTSTGYATDYIVMNNIVYAIVIPLTNDAAVSYTPAIIDISKLTASNTDLGYFPGDLYVRWNDVNSNIVYGYAQQFIVNNNIPSAVVLSEVSYVNNFNTDTHSKKFNNMSMSVNYDTITIDNLLVASNSFKSKPPARFISNHGKIYSVVPATLSDGSGFKLMDISRLVPPPDPFVPDMTWDDNTGNIVQGKFCQFIVINRRIYVIAMTQTQYFYIDMTKANTIKKEW